MHQDVNKSLVFYFFVKNIIEVAVGGKLVASHIVGVFFIYNLLLEFREEKEIAISIPLNSEAGKRPLSETTKSIRGSVELYVAGESVKA